MGLIVTTNSFVFGYRVFGALGLGHVPNLNDLLFPDNSNFNKGGGGGGAKGSLRNPRMIRNRV